MNATTIPNSGVPELLTVEEFAKRFRVGRSTVFLWIASKRMLPGVHYFKIGKTVRIPWSCELLAALSTDETEQERDYSPRSRKSAGQVNLAYL